VEWSSRIPRTVEMIDVLRKLWGPGPVAHQGRFFNFPATYALPAPHAQIPIYIGSIATAALRRTGQIADGWMGMTARLADLPKQINHINEGRGTAGQINEPFEFMVGLARMKTANSPQRMTTNAPKT
jgi:alkanesulfonate monooxygenase SsuD/methylene tetrahydromethanopterin reductase-like flavin-dependent oxidoreductase (luciferase family)